MVQVLGITYRIVVSVDTHHVVRILDDRPVGSFKVRPGFEITAHEIAFDALAEIARTAARLGKVDWPPAEPGWRQTLVRYCMTRRGARATALALSA
jgi:hypothetical protein